MLSPEQLLAIKAAAPDGVADACVRLIIATVLGAVIGVNRELRQSPAGFRTHALVALGAALLALIALSLGGTGAAYDTAAVSRVLQGVIAGIGFIGGGAVLRPDSGHRPSPLEMPTAASAVVLTLLVLTVGEFVDRTLLRLRARGAIGSAKIEKPGAGADRLL
jgi:putative Mg2+ transporter-C (MgtC) family protein